MRGMKEIKKNDCMELLKSGFLKIFEIRRGDQYVFINTETYELVTCAKFRPYQFMFLTYKMKLDLMYRG